MHKKRACRYWVMLLSVKDKWAKPKIHRKREYIGNTEISSLYSIRFQFRVMRLTMLAVMNLGKPKRYDMIARST